MVKLIRSIFSFILGLEITNLYRSAFMVMFLVAAGFALKVFVGAVIEPPSPELVLPEK
jgi:hypothetical protein